MKQELFGSSVVEVNYEDQSLPAAARLIKPIVYKDGDAYCCVSGEDPQLGVFGCGETPQRAIEDWDKHYHETAHQ